MVSHTLFREIEVARKKARGANKSELIRNYRIENPDSGPKAISEALTKVGHKVTPAFVSTVLSNDKRRSGKPKGRRGRRPAGAASNNGAVALNQLIQAKKLADQMGGVDKARTALDSLAKLLA